MSDKAPDYDNICERVGVRIQEGDHLVKAAVAGYAGCKTYKAVINRAEQERAKAVREEKFLVALIHDEIIRDAENSLEAEDDD